MSILSVQNGERGNGLNTGSHKHKVKCRHQRKGQSQHSFANHRIIITDFLAQPSQQLNINKLVAPSCALSFSYHHHFPPLHFIFLWVRFFPLDPDSTICLPMLYISFIYESNALFSNGVKVHIKQANMWIKNKQNSIIKSFGVKNGLDCEISCSADPCLMSRARFLTEGRIMSSSELPQLWLEVSGLQRGTKPFQQSAIMALLYEPTPFSFTHNYAFGGIWPLFIS